MRLDLLDRKLDGITDIWNHFFWEYKYLQKGINFNDEVKTNYYGEILSYFNDTFYLLKLSRSSKFSSNIFHYIGLLQIVYVQQDLMDELLYIFGIQKSPPSDKNPNRKIRNELIGHPIKRNKSVKNELISSVLFSNGLTNRRLEYLIYSKENNFKMQIVKYDPKKIIYDHKVFLNKYFDLIIEKIIEVLNLYKKRLVQFEKLLETSIHFERVLHLTTALFESIFKDNRLYTKETLIECYKRKNEHKRYGNVIEIFLFELRKNLNEAIAGIDDFVLLQHKNFVFKVETIQVAKPEVYYSGKTIEIKVNGKSKSNYKKSYSYELGKLHEKHPVFDIDYFRKCFKSNKSIISELNNMELHRDSDLEYYASYEYLSKLILKKDYKI